METTERKVEDMGTVCKEMYQEQSEDMLRKKIARKLTKSKITEYRQPVCHIQHH